MKVEFKVWTLLGLVWGFTRTAQEAEPVAVAAIASPGDILVLRSKRPLSQESAHRIKQIHEKLSDHLGVKIALIDSDFEVAQLVKFDGKSNDGKRDSDHPLPLATKEGGGDAHHLG